MVASIFSSQQPAFRGGGGPVINLSGVTVSETATIGTLVGVLSVAGGSGVYTFTKIADPDAKFAVSGNNLDTAALLDYEAGQSHSVTVQADNGVDVPFSRLFTITVTNVPEQPALSALTLPASINVGTTVNITGATAGSTITGTVPSGWTINSGPRTIDVSSGAATGLENWSLVETLLDSPNSPRTSPGTSTVVSGPSPLVLSITPTSDYDARFSTVTTSGGRVTSISDLQGLANMTEGAIGIGPFATTDEAGNPCWTLEGAEFLNGATSFVAGTRALTVFMVARIHKDTNYGIFGLGNAAAGTAVNTGGAAVRQITTTNSGAFLAGGGISGSTAATNKAYLLPGCQLQVICVRSAPTAGNGQRLAINRKAANVAQISVNVASVAGFEVGRYPFSPGASGTWAQMDLYRMPLYNYALTDAQVDTILDEIADYYGIPEITDQLVFPGDSITDGVGTVNSRNSLGMVATRPGNPLSVPATTRVINPGKSGSTTVTLTTRRDATNSLFDQLLPGTNTLVVQIGRNNLGALGQTGAQVYSAIVALNNTTTTGYLQRGWTVYQVVNIATSGALQTEVANLRTLLRAPAFLTDCLAGAGQAFDGKLLTVELPLVTTGGATVFDTTADAANPIWYQGDATHPTVAGTAAMWTGLGTPLFGENIAA